MKKDVTSQFLDSQIKAYKIWIIILFILMVCVMIVSSIMVDSAAFVYCKRWGGELYEDNNCYLVEDMQHCIDSNYMIREASRSLVMPDLNFTVVS